MVSSDFPQKMHAVLVCSIIKLTIKIINSKTVQVCFKDCCVNIELE